VATTLASSGIASVVFFSLREYIVSPLLVSGSPSPQFVRRRRELEATQSGRNHEPDTLTWWEMRTHKVPDTTISGAISGGLLNSWIRGRKGLLPGITTGGLVCATLQFAYNELDVTRIKYVSHKLAIQAHPGQDSDIHQNPARLQPSQDSIQPSTTSGSESTSGVPLFERVFSWFGFEKISDDVYLDKLKRERDMYLVRIAKLEDEARNKVDISKQT